MKKQKIELLAPARDAEIGIEAFRHGADAVYIGSPRFSARAAAGNSVGDIERMAAFGHQFGAHTMVAFNTILRDDELEEAQRLIWQLYDAGVDSLIVQDFGILQLDLPPIELHASTQTDNRTIEKVRLMRDLGFSRVVLARELSVSQIADIHREVPDVELECFVHGALCVCYSGQCYLSAALTRRSANRGECAQPCRLPMDLLDADGRVLVSQKHLLSLRDMNRSRYVAQLMDAGVSSLKIEGRLKDMTYVKNVVAYYRQLIDGLLSEDGRSEQFEPLSQGHCTYTFTPDVKKSFNRGFTSYFAENKRDVMWNHDSPKSMGEEIGSIRQVGRDFFSIVTDDGKELHNGDGLVANRTLGFRLNRFDQNTGRIYPLGGAEVCRQLRPGMELRRNLDVAFDQLLARNSADRRVALTAVLDVTRTSISLTLRDDRGVEASCVMKGEFEPAQRPQQDRQRQQVVKMGESIYTVSHLDITGEDCFLQASLLNQLRRETVGLLDKKRKQSYECLRKSYVLPDYKTRAASISAASVLPHDFKANVSNKNAREMYALMDVPDVAQAFENKPVSDAVVMQTKYCLKQALGCCPKYASDKAPDQELSTLFRASSAQLRVGNKKIILKFGCKNLCNSEIITTFAPEF
ncbi:MAG: U32 family peptidase [Bacteroidales bacterium]|nr:U32 family peptidase [Candidatus Liminaster caballi]